MDNLNSDFWIGLAFAIPLSIIGNLLTPKIQNWLATRSESAAKERAVITQREQERITRFIDKPQHLYVYLFGTIVSAIFLGSVVGVFSGLFFLSSSFLDRPTMYASGQFLAILGGLLVAKICFDAINTIGKVEAGGG